MYCSACVYVPTFQYDKQAPTANTIFHLWMNHHRFLPAKTCEPERLTLMIAREIAKQVRLLNIPGIPTCALHQTRMVLLGQVGRRRKRHIHRLSIAESVRIPTRGLEVASGIFRCPVPECYRVDHLQEESSGEPYRRVTIGSDTWLS